MHGTFLAECCSSIHVKTQKRRISIIEKTCFKKWERTKGDFLREIYTSHILLRQKQINDSWDMEKQEITKNRSLLRIIFEFLNRKVTLDFYFGGTIALQLCGWQFDSFWTHRDGLCGWQCERSWTITDGNGGAWFGWWNGKKIILKWWLWFFQRNSTKKCKKNHIFNTEGLNI